MSTLTTTSTPAPPSTPAPIDTPISTLSSPLAQTYTHIHPILLLTIYLTRFNATVSDPVQSLSELAVITAILQTVYAVICLPATSEGTATKGDSGKKAWVKRKGKDASTSAAMMGRIWPALLSTLLTPLLPLPPLTLLTILLGAPITSHIPHTLLLSLHIALLSTTPLLYAHGVSGESWRRTLGLLRPVDEIMGGSMGAVLGAWVGCVPIPLDWDRPWQAYPVTIVTGAYIGYAVGKLLGGTMLKGRFMSFD